MPGRLWKLLTRDPGSSVPPGERAVVRIAVPIAFVASAGLAFGIAHTTEDAPGIAFNNHLVFAGELLLLSFYALLLLAVPLIRGIAAGELPVELTTKGARYPEREAIKGSLKANQELLQRVESVEDSLREQNERANENADIAADGFADLAHDVANLRTGLEQLRSRSEEA